MQSVDFVVDNVGNPDDYTVQTVCHLIRVQEKDRNANVLARFNVYVSSTGTSRAHLAGEEFSITSQGFFKPGAKPFSLETINIASTTFSVIEE